MCEPFGRVRNVGVVGENCLLFLLVEIVGSVVGIIVLVYSGLYLLYINPV